MRFFVSSDRVEFFVKGGSVLGEITSSKKGTKFVFLDSLILSHTDWIQDNSSSLKLNHSIVCLSFSYYFPESYLV